MGGGLEGGGLAVGAEEPVVEVSASTTTVTVVTS